MTVFDFDEDMIAETIANALDEAGSQASEEQFVKIVDAIDESMPGIVELLVYGMQESWKAEARAVSTGWGEKYANSIKAKVSGTKGEVYIDEEVIDKSSNKPASFYVSLVERGMKSFSIKDALMKSDKAKIGKDGVRFITIPFPTSTPRKKNQGTQMSKFGGREMSQEAYKIVKNGGKFSGQLKSGREVSGLTKYVSRQRHEQYGVFIRVSEKSKGWIHPGVSAEPVYPSVLGTVNKRIQEVLSSYCKAIVKEFTS